MTRIQSQDTTSARGERKVSVGILTPEAETLVKAFNFNNKAVLGSILLKPYSVDTTTGIITIENFIPSFDNKAVPGATHVSLLGAYAVINFDTSENEIQYQ